jgi:hypothetical protein
VNWGLAAIVLFCFRALTARADDARIWWPDVKVNGQPVRIIFDTGSDTPVFLFTATAVRLGLKLLPPDLSYQLKPGEFRARFTEPCNLDIGTIHVQTTVKVADMPRFARSLDGVFGWPLVSGNVIEIDAIKGTAEPVEQVPADPTWSKFSLVTNLDVLDFEVTGKDGTRSVIGVDTGSPYGIKLAPAVWRQWKAAHTNLGTTLSAYFGPSVGFVVQEESWAKKISLGPLTLTEVPVSETDSREIALRTPHEAQYRATLCFAALRRLEIIIDGKRGVAWLRPRRTPPLPYEHNRLGAVFVPTDLQSDDLIAHVAPGSPAGEAGIRDGDILLKVGAHDATRWRTVGERPNLPFSEQPAGTKLELTLKRGGEVLTTNAVLRNVLPPDPPKRQK